MIVGLVIVHYRTHQFPRFCPVCQDSRTDQAFWSALTASGCSWQLGSWKPGIWDKPNDVEKDDKIDGTHFNYNEYCSMLDCWQLLYCKKNPKKHPSILHFAQLLKTPKNWPNLLVKRGFLAGNSDGNTTEDKDPGLHRIWNWWNWNLSCVWPTHHFARTNMHHSTNTMRLHWGNLTKLCCIPQPSTTKQSPCHLPEVLELKLRPQPAKHKREIQTRASSRKRNWKYGTEHWTLWQPEAHCTLAYSYFHSPAAGLHMLIVMYWECTIVAIATIPTPLKALGLTVSIVRSSFVLVYGNGFGVALFLRDFLLLQSLHRRVQDLLRLQVHRVHLAKLASYDDDLFFSIWAPKMSTAFGQHRGHTSQMTIHWNGREQNEWSRLGQIAAEPQLQTNQNLPTEPTLTQRRWSTVQISTMRHSTMIYNE